MTTIIICGIISYFALGLSLTSLCVKCGFAMDEMAWGESGFDVLEFWLMTICWPTVAGYLLVTKAVPCLMSILVCLLRPISYLTTRWIGILK